MKKVKFNNLTINNFRNIIELDINFKDTTTEIIASNGKGKTNTLSAILWCLFGKDINDNKQFVVSPIINGEEDNSINTSVKLVINDNYVIERSYFKRVSSLKTGYIIDGKEQLVAVTQTQFKQELIDNVVDEDTFKSLSNINYLTNLHWKELKKFIFDLIGDIKDTEVLLRDDFKLIEEYITRFGIDQTQKLLVDTDKELNDDIKKLETEYQTLLNTKDKYVASEEENKSLEIRKKEIEDILYTTQEKQRQINKQLEEYRYKRQNISSLTDEISRINNAIEFNKSNIDDYKRLYEQNSCDVEQLRSVDIAKINNNINFVEQDINNNQRYLDEEKKILEDLKKQGNELKQKEIKVENSACNACGQTLPEEKIQETLNKLKELHNLEIEKVKQKYDLSKQRVTDLENDLVGENKHLEELKKELESIKTKQYEVVIETDKQKQLRVAREEKELTNIELQKQTESKNNELKVLEQEFEKLEQPSLSEEDNLPLRLELKDINDKLATTITLGKISEDVDKSLTNLNTKKDNKIVNKEKIQQVIKFNNIKADLLKQKVRSYFKIVEFRTKEYTADGTEQETFKIVDSKGVEFKETNTGSKILLGLDLLQGIMKAKDIYVPVIVDNAETVTSDIELDNTQLIIARAIKGIESIEVK